MGAKQSPEWWREYRKRRSAELVEYNRQRRQVPKVKAQRHASEQRRRAKLRAEQQPLPVLMQHLQNGSVLSFWEDELRLDLAQEAYLALLEGRDPDEAVKTYRTRELLWRAITAPILFE